jgi:putative oxidoreductase
MVLTSLTKYRDAGLLILRLGVGLSFMLLHGLPKLQAGTEMWNQIGQTMGRFGIHFAPTAWGFIAALTEGLGGLLIAVGFLFRPACIMLIGVMFVAVTVHLDMPKDNPMGGWAGASHALELGVVFLGLIFIGPGKYSIDKK